MSFAEIASSVKSLSLEEKLQLQSLVAEDLVESTNGLSPEWFKPGMVAYVTPPMTVDPDVLREIYAVAGLKEPG